jgi:hypothetical protein
LYKSTFVSVVSLSNFTAATAWVFIFSANQVTDFPVKVKVKVDPIEQLQAIVRLKCGEFGSVVQHVLSQPVP